MCSQESDFNEHFLSLTYWLLKQGYPEKVINIEMSKGKSYVDNQRPNNRQKKGILFVVTFRTKLKVLQKIINKHLYLLYMNGEVKSAFTPKPMVSFRSPRKISSYLIRAKLYPLEKTVGSCRCGSKRKYISL